MLDKEQSHYHAVAGYRVSFIHCCRSDEFKIGLMSQTV